MELVIEKGALNVLLKNLKERGQHENKEKINVD